MSVGAPIDRIDGRLKVTGGADYASDRVLDGMLYGVPVGSTIAAGTRAQRRCQLPRLLFPASSPCSITPTSARSNRCTRRCRSSAPTSTKLAHRFPMTPSHTTGNTSRW